MKKLMLSLMIVGVLSNTVFALDTSYYRKFLGDEVIVSVKISEYKSKEITMVLTEVNTTDDVLIGKTNLGETHIPVENIAFLRKQRERFQKVWNH